jgi:glycine cleavage system aminomethyltransferase T
LARPDLPVDVEVDGRFHPARIVQRPFYDPEGKRLRPEVT